MVPAAWLARLQAGDDINLIDARQAERTLAVVDKTWQWGKLHQYLWRNASGQAVRGPVMAGGDHTTLNTAAYNLAGASFEVTQIPAMRMIIDFGQVEPMMGQNSTGQSSNPASPHYTDGIDPWLKGQYISFPMQPQNFDKTYGKTRLTLVPGK